MKNPWKEIVIAFLIGSLVGWFAASRNLEGLGKRGHFQKGRMVEKIGRELGLSAEQKEKVRGIFESKRAQFKLLREETHDEIEKILTPEQLPAFQKMEAEWQARREKRARKD